MIRELRGHGVRGKKKKKEYGSPYVSVLGVFFEKENGDVNVNFLWSEDGFKLEFSDSHASALSINWFKRQPQPLLHTFWKKAESSIALPQKRHWPLPLGGWFCPGVWGVMNPQKPEVTNSQLLEMQVRLCPRYFLLTSLLIPAVRIILGQESTPTYCVGRLMHLTPS